MPPDVPNILVGCAKFRTLDVRCTVPNARHLPIGVRGLGGEGEGGRRGRGRVTSIFDDTWGARCYNHYSCELLPPWPIDGCLKASHLSAMAAEVCRSSDYSSELLKKPGRGPGQPLGPGPRVGGAEDLPGVSPIVY